MATKSHWCLAAFSKHFLTILVKVIVARHFVNGQTFFQDKAQASVTFALEKVEMKLLKGNHFFGASQKKQGEETRYCGQSVWPSDKKTRGKKITVSCLKFIECAIAILASFITSIISLCFLPHC